MKNFIYLKFIFRNLIYLCLSIFLLLTGCVSENGLLYFEDGKAKLFSFKFFMDNDVISNKNFNFTYFDLSKTYVSDDYGNVDLNFRADELLKLSSIFFEDGIYLSDYKDRVLDSDFLKRNILEISIPNFNNKVFLPLSIINNCKKLNIVIWLSKEADDEFMRISYGDKGNKSNKFELEFAEFKVEHEFSDYILEIERSFFGIPLIDGVELLDEYLIVDGVFPGVDTPEVYIDDTSELVIMWDTGEILASNNKKDGKKVIVRQGLFECFTNINEELGEQGKTGDRETGLGNEENESEIIEESTEEVKLDSGSETHRNDRDSEEIEIEASRKTVDRETGLGNEENESEIIEESTEEVKLDSGSEAYRNDSEDQVLLDNEELKIKNEKLEEQEVGIREEGESDEKQISNDVDLLIEHSKLDIENLGECKIEKDETNEIELDSGSEAYRNDSEDQVLLDNEELIIKNEELIIKNEELGEQEIEENETIEIELDSGLETYRNDTEEQVLNYSEELKEYFGEDSFEVVYLRDKVIDIADINTFIVIDDGYYFVKVYDVETKIYTIFEVLFNKELEFEKNTVLFIKNEIEELKVRLIADKYLELLYKISDKLYKKIVKKAVRSERVNVENLK